MVKHIHTLAHRALEANNHLLNHIVRIQYNLAPIQNIQTAQLLLDQLKMTLHDIQHELTHDTSIQTQTRSQLK
jgi:hypothetical protein